MDGTTYVTQDPVKTGETFTYEWTVQTPRLWACTTRTTTRWSRCLMGLPARSSSATSRARRRHGEPEQVMVLDDSGVIGYALNGKSFPATAPIVAKQGDWVEVQLHERRHADPPDASARHAQMVIAKDGMPLDHRRCEDTVTVAPGERYTVLVHATELGTWVWHCHILPHAENEHGMFGMVTALVVQ